MTLQTPVKDTVRLDVSLSQWPLVVLTYAGTPSDEQVAAHLREIEERVLARRERFVQVIDQSRGEMPLPSQRALIADHQARMDSLYARYCLGEAYVVSKLNRGAMVAVFWMAKPPYPYTFVDTFDEAVVWARNAIAQANTTGA